MDIDLLGKIENSPEIIAATIKDACRMDIEDDGMTFNADTVSAGTITTDAGYAGVRVRLRGNLGNARITLQIDIGFGDEIVPGPRKVVFPVILDFPAPELNGYTMESTIAEKFHAMVRRGVLSSRMKDFYDVWKLSRKYDFKGEVLARAVTKTFANRNTTITGDPAVFDPSFGEDAVKMIQWRGFLGKAKLADAPTEFRDVVADIKTFLQPPAISLAGGRPFRGTWKAPGPWL